MATNQPHNQQAQHNQQEMANWQAAQQQGFTDQYPADMPMNVDPVTWKSAEYMTHTKTSQWYIVFLVCTFLVAGLILLLTREWLASITILIVGASAGFFASRPPSERQYEINEHEVKIDQRSFPLESFKSFSVVEEGTQDSIWLKPVKRFAPFQIIYFHAEDEQRIIDILGLFLPHEERELDHLDLLSKKLKF